MYIFIGCCPCKNKMIFKNSLIIYQENTKNISSMAVISICDKTLLKISP